DEVDPATSSQDCGEVRCSKTQAGDLKAARCRDRRRACSSWRERTGRACKTKAPLAGRFRSRRWSHQWDAPVQALVARAALVVLVRAAVIALRAVHLQQHREATLLGVVEALVQRLNGVGELAHLGGALGRHV